MSVGKWSFRWLCALMQREVVKIEERASRDTGSHNETPRRHKSVGEISCLTSLVLLSLCLALLATVLDSILHYLLYLSFTFFLLNFSFTFELPNFWDIG